MTSTSVYGRYAGTPFTEESPRKPKDDYGRSKRDGEDMLFQRMDRGLPAVVVRPCTVYGPRCADGAGKAFSRPTSIAAIPGSGRQLLANIRAEDVAAAAVHLSGLDAAVGEVYNLVDDSRPTLEEALTLAAQTFETKTPSLHLPLFLVRALARVDGFVSGLRGRIPDLEYEAARYLSDDYVVDNTKLKATGYEFIYPDFVESMAQMGRWVRSGQI